MITNLPTQESLTEAALKAYFRAWEDLLAIWSDFDGHYESSEHPVISSEWQQEALRAREVLSLDRAPSSLTQQVKCLNHLFR